jgi:hypothetical protein
MKLTSRDRTWLHQDNLLNFPLPSLMELMFASVFACVPCSAGVQVPKMDDLHARFEKLKGGPQSGPTASNLASVPLSAAPGGAELRAPAAPALDFRVDDDELQELLGMAQVIKYLSRSAWPVAACPVDTARACACTVCCVGLL